MMPRSLLILLVALVAACSTDRRHSTNAEEIEASLTEKPWSEAEASFPSPPQEGDLIEFFGPATTLGHRLFIDARALRVDADGVIRYTAIVRTAGGAQSVTFEGLRCKSAERRIYAHGRPSGQWVEAKLSRWEAIRFGVSSEYQAALYVDYFCSGGVMVRDTQVALRALRERATRSRFVPGS